LRTPWGGPTAKNPNAEYCSGGALRGKVPVTSTGVWMNRKSTVTGGRLKVHMACPVAPYYDAIKKLWSLPCIRNDIFTHQKVMIVNGFIRGSVQKYVMSGSSNWSSPGLRESDEIITEIQHADALYAQQLANMKFLDKVVSRNTAKTPKKGNKPKDGKKVKKTSIQTLSITGGVQLDVRGPDLGSDQE
jgi:phosphatidylserine/phosphatidylglycerophosphate/cardiolipin synthase-like enzyme